MAKALFQPLESNMKIDFNGWLNTIGQGMLLTVGWTVMQFLMGFLPGLLNSIPRHG